MTRLRGGKEEEGEKGKGWRNLLQTSEVDDSLSKWTEKTKKLALKLFCRQYLLAADTMNVYIYKPKGEAEGFCGTGQRQREMKAKLFGKGEDNERQD